MKRTAFISGAAVVCACLLIGCGVSETVVVTGIAATNAKNQIEALNNIKLKAKPEVSENRVREAIVLYQASTGFLPKSLQVLIDDGYLPALPPLPEGYEFRYNHVTGVISATLATVPSDGPAARQDQSVSPVVQSTGQYRDYGHALDSAARNSSSSYGTRPSAGTGQPQPAYTGGRAANTAPRQAGGAGVGGGGLMGETVTSIAVSNDLNSMSSGGSSSASSYAWHGMDQCMQGYNQQQAQALNDAGQ
jgi:hypothetical protein